MMPAPPPRSLNFDPFHPDAINNSSNRYGREAYICAHDRNFAKFASEYKPDAAFDYLHHSEEFICKECNVPALEGKQALRWIDSSPESVEKWQTLKAQYDAWLEQQNKGA